MAAGGRGSGGRSANARWAAAGRAKVAEQTAKRLKAGLGVLVLLAIVGFVALGAFSRDDGSTVVPPPGPVERTDTVTLLQRAYGTQQICYGWRLRTGGAAFGAPPVSVGSNLGDNVPVDSDPARCPRWAEVDAAIWYTSESSESEDSAVYRVSSSPDLAHVDFDRGLARLGVDAKQFVDDPGWAVCRAAVFLPLLVSETGSAPASPPPTAPTAPISPTATPAPTASPAPLADAGSDFWRDRWVLLLGAAGILLLTAIFLAIGVFERRRR
ncbi:hypothetical protein O7626_15680 [Micromonospora sp. WMMD1102]|uniref:hypothetical protein n=1 Tax=Micromonospora sp. WMMD1102 TaxID=3016105 RepID=UPI002414F9DF|nr:hypothetical protein [Micromonospora sp. WMMD1102]MDG4787355.1 hypothetical protein [Micromonospora sp. WMMD1102]